MGFYNSSIRNDLCKPHTVLQMRTLKSERRNNEADPLPAFRNYFEKDGFLKGLQLGLDEIERTRDVASCGFQFDSSKEV